MKYSLYLEPARLICGDCGNICRDYGVNHVSKTITAWCGDNPDCPQRGIKKVVHLQKATFQLLEEVPTLPQNSEDPGPLPSITAEEFTRARRAVSIIESGGVASQEELKALSRLHQLLSTAAYSSFKLLCGINEFGQPVAEHVQALEDALIKAVGADDWMDLGNAMFDLRHSVSDSEKPSDDMKYVR